MYNTAQVEVCLSARSFCRPFFIGDGDQELREKLLKSFLGVLLDMKAFPAQIVFSGTGIFLTTQGSPLADLIGQFAAPRSTILSCTTCLEHYNRKDKIIIGRTTTTKETVMAMMSFPRVMAP